MLVLKIVSVRKRNNEEEAEMFDGGVDFVNNDNDDAGEQSAEQTLSLIHILTAEKR